MESAPEAVFENYAKLVEMDECEKEQGIAKRSYDVGRHYDGIADLYRKVESYNPRKHILMKRQFVKIFKDLGGLSVLDLGCGQGFFSRLAKNLGAKYIIGVDASQKQIELARKKLQPQNTFITVYKHNFLGQARLRGKGKCFNLIFRTCPDD